MNQKSRPFKENGLLPPWKIVNSKYTTPLNDGLHNSVKAVQCLTVLMVCRYLVVGYFLSVNIFFVCSKWAWVGRIGAERAAGSRALHSASLVCKAGVAAVRGRVGTGRRLDTQTVFRSWPHPITHTHTHSQPSTIIFCHFLFFPFYTPHLSVQHAFLSVSHPAVFTSQSVCSACLPFCPTSCCLHLCQNVSVSISCSRFAAMPSKKKKTVLVCFDAHPL